MTFFVDTFVSTFDEIRAFLIFFMLIFKNEKEEKGQKSKKCETRQI